MDVDVKDGFNASMILI